MTANPEWLADVGPARSGDAAARARLADAFAPFVHAALLAHLPHHAAQGEVLTLLRSAIAQLGVLPTDADFPRWLLPAVRARAARLASDLGSQSEHAAPQAAVSESRRLLVRLRGLPPATIEKVLARLVEGVPGPELAETYGEGEASVRAELARGAAVLVQSMTGQSVDLQGDNYLWDVRGTPSPALATLETSLTLLRFDGAPDAAPGAEGGFTAAELTPISAEKAAPLAEGKRPTGGAFRGVESTEPSGPKSEWEVATTPAPNVEAAHPQSDPNPFHSKIATIAATDLPAAAAVVQAPPPPPPRAPRTRTAEVPAQQPAPAPAPAQTLFDGDDDSTESRSRPPPQRALPEVDADEAPGEGDRTAMEPAPRALPKPRTEEEHTAVVPIAAPAAPLPNRPKGLQAEALDLTPVGLDPRPLKPKLARGATPFVIAAAFALLAALAAWSGLNVSEKQVRRGFQFTPVLVASRDVPEGTVLELEMVSTRSVPTHYAGKSAVGPDNVQFLLGLKTLVPVQAGDPLLFSQFVEAPGSRHLQVLARTRAITLPTSPRRAVGGMVHPGDRVDVVLTVSDPQTGEKEASTLLQDVRVLAVVDLAQTSRLPKGKERKSTTHVTFAVLPEEAELLTLAKELGQVTLALRGDDDHTLMQTGSITRVGTLLGDLRFKALAHKRAAIVQTIRGVTEAN